MNKEKIIEKLQNLSVELRTPRIRQKDIRKVKKLEYYISLHFGNLAKALKAAGLEPTSLAEKMSTSDQDLLEYIHRLGKKIGKRPTVMDVKRDGRYSEVIFKKRFGNIQKAYSLATKQDENLVSTSKEDLYKILEFPNKGLFVGRAAELHIVAELMYRGFNASLLPVDLGIDVIAVKDSKTFYFQVKNVSFEKATKRSISITNSSFNKNQSNNVFYSIVLQKGETKKVLLLPFLKMRELINQGIIEIDKSSKDFSLVIELLDQKVEIISKTTNTRADVSNYLNDWDVIL